MKKTAFIIAEYNPLHYGHVYHLQQTKIAGADTVVAVMSGNFVQRAEPALVDKFTRAEAAVRAGTDLVLELPVKYAVSNASRFAAGGVETMLKSGIDGFLSFGCNASSEELLALSQELDETDAYENAERISSEVGCSFPKALSLFLEQRGQQKQSELLTDPNNVLALEYIRAYHKAEGKHEFFSVERAFGVQHDSDDVIENTASAKYIRERIRTEGLETVRNLLPEYEYRIFCELAEKGIFPSSKDKFDTAVCARLLGLTSEDFCAVDNVSSGLENRIFHAIRNHADLPSLYDAIKTKRFTHSRIRQIILSAALGITKADLEAGVSYLRILAFNDKGQELLRAMRSQSSLPVIGNLSEAVKIKECQRDADLEYTADSLFNLCLDKPQDRNPAFLGHPSHLQDL